MTVFVPNQEYDRTVLMDNQPSTQLSMDTIVDEEDQAVRFHKLQQARYKRLRQEESRRQEIQRARFDEEAAKEAAELAAINKKSAMITRIVSERSLDSTSLAMDRDEETQAQERQAREKDSMDQ